MSEGKLRYHRRGEIRMSIREQIIIDYFDAWLIKESRSLERFFTTETIYSECYGPEYKGFEQIKQWFIDWNKRGTVEQWDIKQFVHQKDMTVVEWYFRCEYDGENGEFDGVSLIQFDQDNHIISSKEFQSKIPHNFPYA
jgi:hypothetical protein